MGGRLLSVLPFSVCSLIRVKFKTKENSHTANPTFLDATAEGFAFYASKF